MMFNFRNKLTFEYFKQLNLVSNIKNSFLYFSASFLQMLISIFTMPIFAKYLEASDFATIGYFTSISAFFLPMFNLSFYTYYLMNYFKKGNKTDNKEILFNLLFFLSLSNICLFIIGYIILHIYFVYANVSFPLYPFVFIILGTLFLDIYRTFLLINFRVKKKAGSFFLLSSAYVIFNISISLLFVVVFSGGAAGKMLGRLVAIFIIAVFSIVILKKYIKFSFNFNIVKKGLKVVYPLILGGYIYFPIRNIDRIFLERLNDTHEFGIYSIGLRIAGFLFMMGVAISQAFEPDIYRFVNNKKKKKLILYLLIIFVAFLLITLLFIILAKPIINLLTSGRFTEASEYAILISISSFLFIIAGFFKIILKALEKTKQLFIVSLITGVLSIFIYKYFIIKWQFIGAGYAKSVIAIIMILITLFFIKFRNKQIFGKLKIN